MDFQFKRINYVDQVQNDVKSFAPGGGLLFYTQGTTPVAKETSDT